jgi:plasmid stabilization system protein ParE
MPLSHPLVPRYEAKGIRRRMRGNYQIFYRVDADQIYVVRVLHGARDHEALL